MDQVCDPRPLRLFSLTTIFMPLLLGYWIFCLLAAIFITSLIVPSRLLAKRTEWALPFIASVFLNKPFQKIAFEAFMSIVHYTRFFSSPITQRLPDFQIIGMPKAGTTTLASHLRRHPAISGMSGLSLHETMSKESHYFVGINGNDSPLSVAQSRAQYRTLFPTILTQWWAEAVLGHKLLCFDACPVHACLPHVASRMKQVVPQSKIILLIRNPIDALFSAETMLKQEMGVTDLPWTLTSELTEDEVQGSGGRFSIDPEVEELWSTLEGLSFSDPLPSNMPSLFYFRLAAHIKCGHLDRILSSYLDHFSAEDILVVSFDRLISEPEPVVKRILSFVGANPQQFVYKDLPAGMKGKYGGRKIHPTVSLHLGSIFAQHVSRLETMLGCSLGWRGFESSDDQKEVSSNREHVVINLSANQEAAVADDRQINKSEVKMRKTPCGCWLLA